jgi:hypothetical protein
MKLITVLVLLSALLRCSVSAAQSVNADYKAPLLVIPAAAAKPVIDGTVEDAEWQGALSLTALQTTDHVISSRQSRFWMTWDADNLYIAMRSPLREGERLIQAYRQEKESSAVVFDDSYEIWIDVGSKTPDGQPAYFQFLSNYAGARYDVLYEPAVGNMRVGWSSNWAPKNRITPDGKNWEMEIAIPRASIYKDTPFADGFQFNLLVVRNYKRPWEQNSIGGSGSFSVRDSYAHCTLAKAAPALHILSVADMDKQTMGLHFAALSGAPCDLTWSLESDAGEKKDGQLKLEPGKLADVLPGLDLVKPGPGSFRIRIGTADGKVPLLDWSAPAKLGELKILREKQQDAGDQVALTLEFNPVHNYVRVNSDFINYDPRATILRTHIAVTDANGKTMNETDMNLDARAYVRGVVKLPDLAPGKYKTTLTSYAKDGAVLLTRDAQFEKKDPTSFPWWNTTAGNIEKVIAPWTPVFCEHDVFKVWGRTMSVGVAGLPRAISSQDTELLAAPAELRAELADGSVAKAEGAKTEIVSQADHRGVIKVASTLKSLAISSTVTAEFDGMYKVDMTLTPDQALEVKSLKVVLPLKNEFAELLHAKGEGIRYGLFYGTLPKDKTGRIWDCRTVDGQPMVAGSFIPYLWAGNARAGICWFADSDQGWVPAEKTPAIEFRRDGNGSTDLVLNLISSKFTIDKPRTITFAFQATPVKTMHEGWRMDPWWTGDTFKDFACVEPKGGHLIFTSLPFTLDAEKSRQMVEEHHKTTSKYIMGIEKYHQTAVPYFEHIAIGKDYVPEMAYFGDEWRTSVSRGLYYGKTFSDFVIYNLSNWAKTTGIDGFYIDNVNPLADDTIEAGRGYVLPDGRIQPTYQMFDTRRYFLRMRAAFAEQGKFNKIVLHMTNNMIIPWVGAADIAFDGEMNVIFPEMNKDFMDFWTLERLRFDHSGQWGVAVNFLNEYQGKWDPVKVKKAMRAFTGMVILNDTLATGNGNGQNTEVSIGRDRFGIEAKDVRYLGYWDAESGITSETKDVRVSGWLRPNAANGNGKSKLLLAVVNFGEKADARVRLDAQKLGLPEHAQWKIQDAETQEELHVDSAGELVVPVDRHDYRQIIVE